MTNRRYHIPFFQPLPPGDLIAGKGDLRGTFPFSAPRVHHFYMARNAIWHGVDLLGLKPGDEVLLPAYHHGVEAEVLVAKGLKPRFYRVDEGARIHPEDVRRRWGIPRDRPVVLLVPFPQGVGQTSFWPKRIFGEPSRARRTLHVLRAGDWSYWRRASASRVSRRGEFKSS